MSDELKQALDAAPAGGVVDVARPGGRAHIDVVEADRLGVRVRRVGVTRDRPADVATEAQRLAGIRALPERLQPIEVAPALGGAVLRTRPEDVRRREFFEVEVTPGETVVRRTRVGDGGERAPVDFTLTRDQLEGLLDEL